MVTKQLTFEITRRVPGSEVVESGQSLCHLVGRISLF